MVYVLIKELDPSFWPAFALFISNVSISSRERSMKFKDYTCCLYNFFEYLNTRNIYKVFKLLQVFLSMVA